MISCTELTQIGKRHQRLMHRSRSVRRKEHHHIGQRLRCNPFRRIGVRHVFAILWRVDDGEEHGVDVDALFPQLGDHRFSGRITLALGAALAPICAPPFCAPNAPMLMILPREAPADDGPLPVTAA